MERNVNMLIGIIAGIGGLVLGISVVVICSYLCFRKWRKKKTPVMLRAFYQSRPYEEEVPPTPSSIQTDSVYSFAAPSIANEGINPSDTISFSFDKTESPYMELPIDVDSNEEFKVNSGRFRFLDPERTKVWKSGWIERFSRMIETTETYSKAFQRPRNSGVITELTENCDSEDVKERNSQNLDMRERLVVDVPTGNDIYARVKK
ncbi:uncharacterized protein LOC125683493 [Ostrea edulis]|uniref:uncharacterized protein LOC125683493 n=1 Tax=Ostrea edulis TaxID=37623 RepID=UPI002094B78A|nr:uncharacterized protein LOC125683493 [Ostrea edulis]